MIEQSLNRWGTFEMNCSMTCKIIEDARLMRRGQGLREREVAGVILPSWHPKQLTTAYSHVISNSAKILELRELRTRFYRSTHPCVQDQSMKWASLLKIGSMTPERPNQDIMVCRLSELKFKHKGIIIIIILIPISIICGHSFTSV